MEKLTAVMFFIFFVSIYLTLFLTKSILIITWATIVFAPFIGLSVSALIEEFRK